MHYVVRGEKALFERPMESLEHWALFLAHKSGSWRVRVHDDAPLFYSSDADLIAEYLEEQQAFKKHVKSLQEKKVAIRAAAARYSRSPGGKSGASWGASRISIAQSWWIASELVRRHPHLMTYEMHPGGGQYDVLCVTDPDSLSPNAVWERNPRLMLNRTGTLQVHRGDDSETVATWAEVLEAPTPHSVVKDLERRAGWPPVEPIPATTSRALVYRLFASLLTMTLNDRSAWDVRSEFLDTSGYGSSRAGFLDFFPAALEASRTTPHLGIYGEPASHFWGIRRNDETVAIVSMEGQAYLPKRKPLDLMAAYDTHNRRMIPMTTALLKKWL